MTQLSHSPLAPLPGHGHQHPTCLWKAWTLVPSLPLRSLCHGKELGLDFGGKEGEQLPSVRLSPAPLHVSAAGSSLQIKRKEKIHQGGELTKILCSPAHWQQTLYLSLSWGSCREPSFVWKEGLTGLVWWIVWKVSREQLKRGKGRQILLAFFHYYLGYWKSYLWNSEATVNSWRETRCSKHFVPDQTVLSFAPYKQKARKCQTSHPSNCTVQCLFYATSFEHFF